MLSAMIDFSITSHGSLALLRAHTPEAQAVDFQWAMPGVVEPRYVPNLISALLEDGFRVSLNGQEVDSVLPRD